MTRSPREPLGPDSLTWSTSGTSPSRSSCCCRSRSQAPASTAPPRDRRGLPMRYVLRHRSLVERAGSLVHITFSLAGLRPARGRGHAA